MVLKSPNGLTVSTSDENGVRLLGLGYSKVEEPQPVKVETKKPARKTRARKTN